MEKTEKVFEWCLNQGKKKEHKGLRKITPDIEESRKHLEKAKYNLKVIDNNIKEFPDWAVSACFYSEYHALLAILFKLGYESRNQECTINAVEYFIKKGKINLNQKYIEMIRRTSKSMPKDSKTLREEFQYGTEVKVDKAVLENLRENAIEFVNVIEILLEEM